MSKGAFSRVVRVPLLVGAALIAGLAITGVHSVGALVGFGLCAFTATSIAAEFVRGGRVHRVRGEASWIGAIAAATARNRRRYGGYVVHLGVVLIVIGLSGAAFSTERHALLAVGETMDVGSYELTYRDRIQTATEEKQVNTAFIDVARDGEAIGVMRPQRNFHLAQEQPQSEVAIRTTPVEDLYVVITSFDQDGSAAVRAFVNPLTWWIWTGAAVMLGGMAVLLCSPSPVRVTAPVRADIREPAVATR